MRSEPGVAGVLQTLEGGVRLLNRNQRATARQLSLAAYLLSSDGRAKSEASIRENLPPYAGIHAASLARHGGRDLAEDALRKQLHRDVEALAGVGITVHVEGMREGRLYSLPPGGFSPAEVDLSDEERAVLVGALQALRKDFPYAGGGTRWIEERPELDLIEEHGDGSADYDLYYTDPGWAARRVMRYLGEAVVLEPEELRREIHLRATALLETYGDGA